MGKFFLFTAVALIAVLLCAAQPVRFSSKTEYRSHFYVEGVDITVTTEFRGEPVAAAAGARELSIDPYTNLAYQSEPRMKIGLSFFGEPFPNSKWEIYLLRDSKAGHIKVLPDKIEDLRQKIIAGDFREQIDEPLARRAIDLFCEGYIANVTHTLGEVKIDHNSIVVGEYDPYEKFRYSRGDTVLSIEKTPDRYHIYFNPGGQFAADDAVEVRGATFKYKEGEWDVADWGRFTECVGLAYSIAASDSSSGKEFLNRVLTVLPEGYEKLGRIARDAEQAGDKVAYLDRNVIVKLVNINPIDFKIYPLSGGAPGRMTVEDSFSFVQTGYKVLQNAMVGVAVDEVEPGAVRKIYFADTAGNYAEMGPGHEFEFRVANRFKEYAMMVVSLRDGGIIPVQIEFDALPLDSETTYVMDEAQKWTKPVIADARMTEYFKALWEKGPGVYNKW